LVAAALGILLAGAELLVNGEDCGGSGQTAGAGFEWPSDLPDPSAPSGTWRMAASMADLSVRVEKGGKTLRLKRRHAAFHSRLLPGWNWVGPIPALLKERKELEDWPFVRPGKPDQVEIGCLWAHPVEGARLVLSFGAAPAAGELDLLLAYLKTAAPDASTTVQIRRNGTELHREVFVGGGGDSRRLHVPLEVVGGPQQSRPAPLELVIEPGKRGKNHLCLDGIVRFPGTLGAGEAMP